MHRDDIQMPILVEIGHDQAVPALQLRSAGRGIVDDVLAPRDVCAAGRSGLREGRGYHNRLCVGGGLRVSGRCQPGERAQDDACGRKTAASQRGLAPASLSRGWHGPIMNARTVHPVQGPRICPSCGHGPELRTRCWSA